MNTKRLQWGLVIVLAAANVSVVRAQAVPAVPGIPAAPSASSIPGASSATPSTSSAGGLSGFCAALKQCCQDCKNSLCGSPLGMLMGGMMAPMSMMTGGIMSGCCSTPTQSALNAGGAEGAAAAIQQDEANAKKRRAAVRYLGTVDCHYWPEAEKSLIGSLRTDNNECVRWEAAMALGSGCCCTRKTLAALTLVVNASDKDGNPSETSERVRKSAEESLRRCLGCYKEIVKEPERPEKPGKTAMPAQAGSNPGVELAMARLRNDPATRLAVAEAQRAVAAVKPPPAAPITDLPNGRRSLLHIFTNAREPGKFSKETPRKPGDNGASLPVLTAAPAASVYSGAEPPAAQSARPTTEQLLSLLRTSSSVLQREWAVQNLARTAWWDSPEATAALVTAAKMDNAATVREACQRCLARRNVAVTPQNSDGPSTKARVLGLIVPRG